MKQNSVRHAYLTLGLLLSMIVIGSVGYTMLGYTFSEAIYQTIITIATVGFEEVHPLDTRGMWFTSVLVIFSIGIFAYAVTTFTRFIVEGVFRNTYKDTKVKRKIDRLTGHVVICGYGRNGKQAAIELLEHRWNIVVIEKDPELVQSMRETPGMLYVEGDASDEEVLQKARIDSARALITTLPIDADNLFVVLTAREMNPDLKIISRASVENSDAKLKRAGANNVIMSDRIGGQRMAKLVAQPDIVEFIDYMLLQHVDSVVLEGIPCDRISAALEDKPIGRLYEANTSQATIIGLKREDNSYHINPDAATVLCSTDKIFALGTRSQIRQLIDTLTSAP